MPDIERVTLATLLGILTSPLLSQRKQDATANKPAFYTSCHSSNRKAWQFRPYIMQLFTGLIMSKITYALPAFAGQLTVDDRNRISAISRKALRRGVTHTAFDIEEITDNFDRKLFSTITHSGHCLHHLLPPKTSEHCSYSLRKRKHYYQLANVEFSLYKNCFINRRLFKFR